MANINQHRLLQILLIKTGYPVQWLTFTAPSQIRIGVLENMVIKVSVTTYQESSGTSELAMSFS